MFKISGFENEIFQSMKSKLSSNQLENKFNFNKISKAADYLNSAASLFEKAGMYKEAEEIIKILSDLSSQLSNK